MELKFDFGFGNEDDEVQCKKTQFMLSRFSCRFCEHLTKIVLQT